MLLDPNALYIYVDGSAYRNPGHQGGFAMIIEYPESFNRKKEIFKFSFSETTSNRMELRACTKAMGFAKKNARNLGINRVIIVTDSEYVFHNQNSAIYWKKAKWRNKDGRPVENHDIWNEFISTRYKVGVRTDIEWRKGKMTEILKEVDKSAKEAAAITIKNTDFGYSPGKILRTKLHNITANLFTAKNQKLIIRIYRKEIKDVRGEKEYKIFFEVFSKEENKYVSKHYAYAKIEFGNELHRGHCYNVRFNDNPRYPVIEEIISEIDKL